MTDRFSRSAIVLDKELRDLVRNPGLMATMLVPALLLTALAVLALYAAGLAAATAQGAPPKHLVLPPLLTGASRAEAAQFLAISPFFLIWLVFPVSVPSALAAYSIVGEKEEGTLEPLLATPIGTGELLLGKALAAGLPGLVLTWASWLVTVLSGFGLGAGRVMQATLLTPAWLLGLGVLAPALTFLTVMVLVIVSSRVNDVRSATQIGGVLVLPIIGMFVSQISRGLVLGVPAVLWAIAGVLAAGLVAMAMAVRLFRRETILVRWKQSR